MTTHSYKRSERAPSVNKRRWATFNKFIDDKMQHISSSAASVWLVLFRHSGGTGEARVSVSTLSRSTGLSKNTVMVALKKFASGGTCSRGEAWRAECWTGDILHNS